MPEVQVRDFRKGRSGRSAGKPETAETAAAAETEVRERLLAINDLVQLEAQLRGAGDPVTVADGLRRIIRFLRGEGEP